MSCRGMVLAVVQAWACGSSRFATKTKRAHKGAFFSDQSVKIKQESDEAVEDPTRSACRSSNRRGTAAERPTTQTPPGRPGPDCPRRENPPDSRWTARPVQVRLLYGSGSEKTSDLAADVGAEGGPGDERRRTGVGGDRGDGVVRAARRCSSQVRAFRRFFRRNCSGPDGQAGRSRGYPWSQWARMTRPYGRVCCALPIVQRTGPKGPDLAVMGPAAATAGHGCVR